MCHCLVIYFVSSTDQIYHLAASRLGDKCDRSMTLGKLLDNNAQFFIFISLSLNDLSCALRRCDLLFVWFFLWGGGFWKKFVCPPHFLAPSYATGTFSAHKAKAQVHFCDHAQSIVLINPSSAPPSFESHSFCRPSRICIFDFLSWTAWWIFVNLGRDEVLMVP